MSRAVMQQALDALEKAEEVIEDEYGGTSNFDRLSCAPVITALRAALLADVTPAQMAHADAVVEPEQNLFDGDAERYARKLHEEREYYKALFTAPTPHKPLTDEEIDRVTDQQWAQNNHKPIYAAHRAYARAIERAHGIGEQDGS